MGTGQKGSRLQFKHCLHVVSAHPPNGVRMAGTGLTCALTLWHRCKESHPGYFRKGRTCACLPDTDRCPAGVSVLCGQEGRAGKEEEEEGPSGAAMWWGLWPWPTIDGSVPGRGEREPTRVSEPPPNIKHAVLC